MKRSRFSGLLAVAVLTLAAFAVGAASPPPLMGPPDPGPSVTVSKDVDPISLAPAARAKADIPVYLNADSGTGAASALKAHEQRQGTVPGAPRTLYEFQRAYPDLKPDQVMTQAQRDQLEAIVKRMFSDKACDLARYDVGIKDPRVRS